MPRTKKKDAADVTVADASLPAQQALGGGLEGASRMDREVALWNPSFSSPDQIINPGKALADARGRDIVQNDGYATGAVALHRDNIVGSQYRLNAKPNVEALGVSEEWGELFQINVESRFNTLADSQDCWFDASRKNTLTGLVRLAVGGFLMSGEVLATAEWIKEYRRPFSTAIQMISPSRLSNKDDVADDQQLRRGMVLDFRGRCTAYQIRNGYSDDPYGLTYRWTEVPAEKPWGRKLVCHIVEQLMPEQNRGIADMVAVLKQMKMTKKFQEITLQQAVVAATYAAAIESELPPNMVFEQMGGGGDPGAALEGYIGNYMSMMGDYLAASKNIAIDGVKMPHLFPGTKLNIKSLGTPGGVGDSYERSLLRHTASALGLSYEQFSRDYSNTNYSSARASMGETWKFMSSRKKMVADRTASFIYQLWLEEEWNAGRIPIPEGKTKAWFYEPGVKDAICAATWIGASRGQIDELKETQAAILRINSGLSTYEKEIARLGEDFREVFQQRSREMKMAAKLGLDFTMAAEKTTSGASTQGTLKENGGRNEKGADANTDDEDF